MENPNFGLVIHLFKSRELASSLADEAFTFFNEKIKVYCIHYFDSKEKIETEKFFSDAFKEIAESYINEHEEEIDEYIKGHQKEHDEALKSDFFKKQDDPEKMYRLSLLNANYTLYARKDDDAIIVDLSSNLPLLYEKKEEPVIKVEPVVEPVKVIEEPVEEESVEESEENTEDENNPFANIKRRTFLEKLKRSDYSIKGNYKEIKKAATEAGLIGRISKSADTYHLGRKTYLKITISGKTLKCYFALDAKDYVDTAIPLEVVDNKKAYEDTPTLLRVKSPLALRRALKLINDMMEKVNNNND